MCMVKWSLFSILYVILLAQPPTQADDAAALQRIKRICVDRLAGQAPLVDAVREMAFAALFSAKRFTVLEKCEKADATLKGAVLGTGDAGRVPRARVLGTVPSLVEGFPVLEGSGSRRRRQHWRSSRLLRDPTPGLCHLASRGR